MTTINRAPYNLLVDEPAGGDGSTGTKWNKNQIKTVLLDPIDVALATLDRMAPSVATFGTAGNVTALPLPGTGTGHLITQFTNATLTTIQGMTAGIQGQRWTLMALGAGQVDVSHNDAAAAAANRCQNWATSGKTSLAAATSIATAGVASYVYHTGVGWRLVSHEQGNWITPPYASTNFTPVGKWFVEAGDVTTYAYRLSGKSLTVSFYLQATSVSLNPTTLSVAIPGGFTAAKSSLHPIVHDDAGGGNAGSFALLGAAGAVTIDCYKTYGTGSFTNSSHTTRVFATITLEVN